jgi:cytochrome b pre-mRNA-processing protein 3
MLASLFRRLTAAGERAEPLFAAVTSEARRPHWYFEGKVADSLDGRFAVLATVAALTIVRLERDAADGDSLSVALTERFIHVMESEHRQMGLGDPALGKKVRKLVGSLARRVDLWRQATAGEADWAQAADDSIYKGAAAADALSHSAEALRQLWTRLERSDIKQLVQGRIG